MCLFMGMRKKPISVGQPGDNGLDLGDNNRCNTNAFLNARSKISPSFSKLFSAGLASSWPATVKIPLNSTSTAHALNRAALELSTSSCNALSSIPATETDISVQ
jgi:hypothetical protein